MAWQTIETFPKDGKSVVVFGDGRLWVAQWTAGDGECLDGVIDAVEFDDNLVSGLGCVACSEEVQFTHWMPLPAPPSGEN